jgi:hypothetical protein
MANWKVLDMNHRTSDGYVIEVTSACEKTDAPGYARKVFSNEFEGTPHGDYIPYENLTEEVVLGWVKNSLGPEVVSKTESDINAQALANKQAIENPPVESGKPWGDSFDPTDGGGGINSQ